jgi:hypothetical protein
MPKPTPFKAELQIFHGVCFEAMQKENDLVNTSYEVRKV